jgi:hypothetical protein
MKKQLLLVAIVISCITPSFAQVEGEAIPMELSTEGQLTYVKLLNDLRQNISSRSFTAGWSDAYSAWTNNGENKNTFKQSTLLLSMMANHIPTKFFKPEWTVSSAEWHKILSSCKDKNKFVQQLKYFESNLLPEAFMESWKNQRTDWLKNVEKKLAE